MKGLKWRILIVLGVLLWAALYLVPTFVAELPSWWGGILPQNKIHLGLDLKGGIHLVLEVKAEDAVKASVDNLATEIEGELKEGKIPYLEVKREGLNQIKITLVRQTDLERLRKIIEEKYPDLEWKSKSTKERLQLVQLNLKSERSEQIKRMAVSQALETIRNRIDQFGVAEPDIRLQGKDRVLVQLPGIKDPQRAINIIGKTARLEFKLVDDEHSLEKALKGNIPPEDEILYGIQEDKLTHTRIKVPYLIKRRTLITGDYIADARVLIDPELNEPYVAISFNKQGARIFARITETNVGKRLAIILDNKVHSAPVIKEKIPSGEARITGNFTMEEAKDLAVVLRAGALPAPVEILEERTVGPSLGQDSIRKGVKASIVGGILVVVFIAIYYGLSGIIADTALIVNLLLLLAGLAFFQATLTLPGIAGIALTIGMGVDANVLIFERIREELRLGRTPRAATEAGYRKALWTIFDANTTTLITALILFQFGTGPIRGFAVTLSLGIMANMFTAIFMCKVIFDYLFYALNLKRLSI